MIFTPAVPLPSLPNVVLGFGLEPLLYSLVAAELLIVEGERFSNTPESDHFLVRGKPTYQGGRHENVSSNWNATLKTAESIRAGAAQAKLDFHAMIPQQEESFHLNQS